MLYEYTMSTENKKIFKDIRYFITSENSQVKQLLKDGDAQREFYVTSLVNYVITDTCNFVEYEKVMELKIPVVTTNWIHMSIRCDSVLPPEPFSPVKNKLFSNFMICPSQIASNERDGLLAMILFHGGRYKTSLDLTCTHLVLGKANGKKFEAALQHRSSIKIVTVDWIGDCVKNLKLLPESEYEPAVLGPRNPLKLFNSHQTSMQGTPKIANSTQPSTFMTPVTPSQTMTTTSPILKNLEQGSDNKENVCVSSSANPEVPSFGIIAPVDLLKGFNVLFVDYKERLPPETYNVWKDVIIKASGNVEESYTPDVTHVLCLHQQSKIFKKALAAEKKISTAYWLNDVLVAKKYFPPETPLHLPVPFTETIPGVKNALISVTGYESRERNLVKHMINFLGAQYTGYLSRNHSYLICKSQTGEKYMKAKEWGIPVVSAKWLGDMIQTGQSLPCKSKTKYATLGTTDEFLINPTFSKYITEIWDETTQGDVNAVGTKRKIPENEDEIGVDGQPKEKQRKLPSNVKRVLFTGLTGTIVHRLRQNVLKLRGELARTVNDCTHLVAPKITRTVKFLSAVSICKFLVAPSWVDDSIEAKSFLDESNYTLVDPESEELFGFKLKRSLQRAQTRPVCKGLHFHVTPSILPAPNAMREIIECAGGKMTEIETVDEINGVFLSNCKNDMTHNSYLVSCADDKQLWADIVKDGYDIYNVELILSGVMKQELEWNLHHL